ncbi:hypothetical protein EVAR_56189_1 [Eumeta japonica]|uniref:Uncharacterized protein n=1 Tax=Eumeta variegata TaxID=151549 RepID=A0A4C1ZWQ7_EUMVA|nr:hypothetical protein EVAR_56189_1 [Eumeta japonica]
MLRSLLGTKPHRAPRGTELVRRFDSIQKLIPEIAAPTFRPEAARRPPPPPRPTLAFISFSLTLVPTTLKTRADRSTVSVRRVPLEMKSAPIITIHVELPLPIFNMISFSGLAAKRYQTDGRKKVTFRQRESVNRVAHDEQASLEKFELSTLSTV